MKGKKRINSKRQRKGFRKSSKNMGGSKRLRERGRRTLFLGKGSLQITEKKKKGAKIVVKIASKRETNQEK